MSKASLKSLIKSVKRQQEDSDNLSILPLLETHFLKEATKPHIDVHWHGKKAWHPSSVSKDGMCPRLEQIRECRPDLLPSKKKTHSTSLMRIFALGTAIHSMYQNEILGPMGILWAKWLDLSRVSEFVEQHGIPDMKTWRLAEKRMEQMGIIRVGFMPDPDEYIMPEVRRWRHIEFAVHSPEHNVVGHCDGILKVPNWPDTILEIKSANDRSFRYRNEPMPKHYRQNLLYQHCEGLGHGLILYVNKDNSTEKEFFFRMDKDELYSMLDILNEADAGVKNESLSHRHSACKSAITSKAAACDAVELCFGCGIGKDGWNELKNL